jgi:hypothetical protein
MSSSVAVLAPHSMQQRTEKPKWREEQKVRKWREDHMYGGKKK